jgi:hypothetical protein
MLEIVDREHHGIIDPIQVTHGNGYWFKGQNCSGADVLARPEPD